MMLACVYAELGHRGETIPHAVTGMTWCMWDWTSSAATDIVDINKAVDRIYVLLALCDALVQTGLDNIVINIALCMKGTVTK